MQARWRQVVWALVLILPLPAMARGPYATQLAAECDAMIQSALRRPYGWAWDTVPPESSANTSTPRHVVLEPGGTPAAGLCLLWSGKLLDEQKYQQAAIQAARGITATQTSVGKIPEHAIFAASSASAREPQQAAPDRSATRSALVLMLAILDVETNKQEFLTRSSQRAAQWMIRQQAADGGWLVGFPPDALPRDTQRIIKLDENDYRDSTLAMLLAAGSLSDPMIPKSAEKAIAKLLSLRLGTTAAVSTTQPAQLDTELLRRCNNLWSTAYRPDGTIDPRLEKFPAGADILASRLAMQTLTGAYLTGGDKNVGLALEAAHRAALDLRSANNDWRRMYFMEPSAAAREQQDVGNLFRTASTQPQHQVGTFGMPSTLQNIEQLKLLGRQRYLTMLEGSLTLRQRLMAAVCGLTDDPFALDLPVTRDEISGYLKQHDADWQELALPIPQDLSARVHRLWLLLIRTRLEQMQQG